MKKVFSVSILFLLLFCLLTGCDAASSPETERLCSHQWSEADCLTASVCALCGKTAGTPLGHNWTDATCESPSTCTRCAETQGETLPHSYGQWIIHGTDMTRTCCNCDAAESSEIDREIYMHQLLSGQWDLTSLPSESEANKLPGLDIINPYLRFEETGEILFYHGNQTRSCTLEFQKYDATADGEFYTALLHTPDQSPTPLTLQDGEEDLLTLSVPESDGLLFSKYELLTDALSLSWLATERNRVYALRLNEDHTFSGNLGNATTGTWHLKPLSIIADYRICNLNLRYLKEGTPVVITGMVNLGPTYTDLEQYLAGNPELSFGLFTKDFTLTFHPASEEEISALTATMEEATAKLIGNWFSRSVRTHNENTGRFDTAMMSDYTMTFGPDATFTAQLDQEYTGIWSFKEFSDNRWYYELEFEDLEEPVKISTDGTGQLTLTRYTPLPLKLVDFISEAVQAEWEQKEEDANSKILGIWHSTRITIDSNGTVSQKPAMDHTLTFSEDGTFTASIDQNYTGSWKFNMTDQSGTGITNYWYVLHFDGTSTPVSAILTSNGLSIESREDSVSRNIMFTKTAATDILQIVGTWKTVSGDSSTSGYTLTVNSDGTFTASFNEKNDGIWYFIDVAAEEGFRYGFRYSGRDTSYLFSLNHENLQVMIPSEADMASIVTMNKA